MLLEHSNFPIVGVIKQNSVLVIGYFIFPSLKDDMKLERKGETNFKQRSPSDGNMVM